MSRARRRGPVRFAAVLLACLCGPLAHAEPALWRVTDGDATVWLFGSVHLLPEGGFGISGELADALESAERVCMEIDADA